MRHRHHLPTRSTAFNVCIYRVTTKLHTRHTHMVHRNNTQMAREKKLISLTRNNNNNINQQIRQAWRLSVCLSVCCVTSRREWALLSFQDVCLSVGHSATYSLPRLIDHNQIWSAGIYLSLDPCKPFWIPYLPYFRCQREKYAKFRLFPMRIIATANVTHRTI